MINMDLSCNIGSSWSLAYACALCRVWISSLRNHMTNSLK